MSKFSSLSLGAICSVNSLKFEARLLGGVWLLFAVLVAAGIHGSSTGVAAAWWAPEKPYDGYLFKVSSDASPDPANLEKITLKSFLMEDARYIRADEFAVYNAYALSQFAQHPRFPVINTSYGNGQNMLAVPQTPVLHIATLARPATWGYFLLGKQRGLAWYWWLQVFGCFTALFLLFRVILKGHSQLSAFGAFWFCASAYSVCWSNWPDYIVMFAALGCLALYQLLASPKKKVQLACGILLGLCIPAFVMFMYPAWQVQVAYLALVLFVALVIRDKLHQSGRTMMRTRLLGFGVAAAIAGTLTISWLVTCLPDLRILSHTVYPGQRVSLGGSYSLAELFKGLYNLITIYNSTEKTFSLNQSEVASFYYFFPAIFLALPFSSQLRGGMGAVGRSMLLFILAALCFLFIGIPAAIAKVSLLSYVPVYRADLSIGLASIVLCLTALAAAGKKSADKQRYAVRALPVIVAVAVSILFIFQGLALLRFTQELPPPPMIIFMSLLMGYLSYVLLAQKKLLFCALVAILVTATTAIFNPLATNLDHIYDSELATKVLEIDSQPGVRPLWLCFGGHHVGALISILGRRSMTGIQWTPQLDLWHTLDPDRSGEQAYNSYNEVTVYPSSNDAQVYFTVPRQGVLWAWISPNNPALKKLGVRYVIQWADAQEDFDTTGLRLLYQSSSHTFRIFEIP